MCTNKSRRIRIRIYIILGTILAMGAIAFNIYVFHYYHADSLVNEIIEHPSEGIIVEAEKNYYVVRPDNPKAGLIFYPGGKVQYEAYLPLMQACAERGFLCVLLHMPYNLAVFDNDAAKGYIENFPNINRWYLGGHSLGGAMAAYYISSHTKEYEGLVLLAAYSTKDLTTSGLKVLSIYGSEDRVLNRTKYENNLKNLPIGYKEIVIQGGCHAFFGDYGFQKGDGTPTISREFQIKQTADAIANFI